MVPPVAPPGPRRCLPLAGVGLLASVGLFVGCASPGAPRPPSLQLPAVVQDLTATRSGEDVELRFTAPTRTTDDVPLRSRDLQVSVCRQLAPGAPCRPVAPAELTESPAGNADTVQAGSPTVLRDHLPASLEGGPAKVVGYRMELRNPAGRSAGFSDPVFAAAGIAPPTVTDLHAQGTRNGVLLQWAAAPEGGEVLLERQQIDPAPAASAVPAKTEGTEGVVKRRPKPGSGRSARLGPEPKKGEPGALWMQADPGNQSAVDTVDNSAVENVRYRYVAFRRQELRFGGRTLELRSAASAPVEIVWRDVYASAAPQGLTAVGFTTGGTTETPAGSYAIDLIWEPVDDARLAGYLVRRTTLSPAGEPLGAPEQLTPAPILSPAFHDAQALSSRTYRYEVVAVDPKGNASAPATAVVQAAQH